jgi:prepilin-type N-terminal cleavage/methylation domain-containing protein
MLRDSFSKLLEVMIRMRPFMVKTKSGFSQHHLSISGSRWSSLVLSMKSSAGFTLIELLVVIAIIGLLAAVAMVNLNTARQKARIASAKATMDSLRSAAYICIDNGNLSGNAGNNGPCLDTGTLSIPADAAGNLCTTAAMGNWPNLTTTVPSANIVGCRSNLAAATFNINANSTGTGTNCYIVCDESTCTYTGPDC